MNQHLINRIVAEESELAAKIVFEGYTHGQLDAAFALVANADHWKGEIDAVVNDTAENRSLIGAATVFFAGSPSEFTRLPGGKMRVRARGYFACIGA